MPFQTGKQTPSKYRTARWGLFEQTGGDYRLLNRFRSLSAVLFPVLVVVANDDGIEWIVGDIPADDELVQDCELREKHGLAAIKKTRLCHSFSSTLVMLVTRQRCFLNFHEPCQCPTEGQ